MDRIRGSFVFRMTRSRSRKSHITSADISTLFGIIFILQFTIASSKEDSRGAHSRRKM